MSRLAGARDLEQWNRNYSGENSGRAWPVDTERAPAAVQHRTADTAPSMIRAARAADVASVLAINAAGAPGVSALDAAELDRLAGVASWFRVAESNGAVCGYLLAFDPSAQYDGEEFRWFRDNVPDSPYIDQVAVLADARRLGVASALYADAAAFALRSGLRRLGCEVNLEPPNPASSHFHERLGFIQIATLPTADGRVVSPRVRELNAAGAPAIE